MIAFYAKHFDAVEINNTFYRMPSRELLETWAGQVPPSFVFALKAPRVITHIRRLTHAEQETEHLIRTCAVMGEKLGPILFQLPGTFIKNIRRLRAFLDLVPPATAAFEFRHESWFTQEVFDLLRERRCALCVSDREPLTGRPGIVSTASWGYMRLRRPGYSDPDLASWHQSILAQGWETAYVFFKHEDQAEGPALAARFLHLAGG
jgi:uncharacterized protein YecE (DUF72 family)